MGNLCGSCKKHIEPCELSLLRCESSTYRLDATLEEGGFATVARFVNVATNQPVAVKIMKKKYDSEVALREAAILEEIKDLDPDKNHLLKFFEFFHYKGRACLVTELLDKDLFDFMTKRNCKPLHVFEIRTIAKQMLMGLSALKTIALVHTDIKLDNIMLVDHKTFPFKVKLVDFGLAKKKSELFTGDIFQPLGFMAPEVLLGLPQDESLDMWSLGCVLATIYTGNDLFSTVCEYQMVRSILTLRGQPPDYVLDRAVKVNYFFERTDGASARRFRLKTEKEHKSEVPACKDKEKDCLEVNSLSDLKNMHLRCFFRLSQSEKKDGGMFLKLLDEMLAFDKNERICPEKALRHPFITMRHLSDKRSESYLESARDVMAASERGRPNDSKPKMWPHFA